MRVSDTTADCGPWQFLAIFPTQICLYRNIIVFMPGAIAAQGVVTQS
jgi:hypothetical protein